MNRYQRRLHREVKEYMKDHDTGYGYRVTRKAMRFFAKRNIFSPCENCDRAHCGLSLNKIIYCSKWD